MAIENKELSPNIERACLDTIWSCVQKFNPELTFSKYPPEWDLWEIRKPWRFLPFIKQTIATVSPSCSPDEVRVVDPKYQPLVQDIKTSLAKLWYFGKPYTPTARDLDLSFGRQVLGKIVLMTRDEFEGNIPTPSARERNIKAVLEVHEERVKKQMEAVN